MKRSQFLAAVGSTAMLPLSSLARSTSGVRNSNCVLIPSETAGPFPLDLTDNTYYFRQDIREDRTGVPLRQKVRIVGADNCEPMVGVRVNVWHCDADGNYSGYGTQAGLTYCRGYQITDENGECEFLTIVPGWYPGRVTHVHFQVHVSTAYSAVSQWTWPHDAVVQALLDHAELYPAGPDPMTADQDGVFADGYALQLASLEWDEVAGEYVSTFEATVEGAGLVGVGYEEAQTAHLLSLHPNAPNPCTDRTAFPLTLWHPAEVGWRVFDLQGRCVHVESPRPFAAGSHLVELDCARIGLHPGGYVIQVSADSPSGLRNAVKRFLVG